MQRFTAKWCVIAAALLLTALPTYAIFGLGAHYALDLTTKLDDTGPTGEPVAIDGLSLDLSTEGLPAGIPLSVSGAEMPLMVDRIGFKTTPINFGGKLYIDVIPVIDIEVAANFFAYSYKGSIRYPKSFVPTGVLGATFGDMVTTAYDTLAIQVPLSQFGIEDLTPFAKLQTDLTIRKSFVKIPPLVSVLKVYAGGGPSLIFATPILSGGMLSEALGTTLQGPMKKGDMATVFTSQANKDKLTNHFMENLLTPHFGFHVIAGAQVKPPIIPLALYLDTKFTVGGKVDKHAELGASGLAVMAGLALAF